MQLKNVFRNNISKNKREYFDSSVFIQAGVEYFISSNFSLSAYYSLGYTYSKRYVTRTSRFDDTITQFDTSSNEKKIDHKYGTGNSGLILAVYF
ncbi:MAG: hypothetical protein HRU08_13610 [Oleispira sp.]|nr:hypothetical protein [Oleispira sp.]